MTARIFFISALIALSTLSAFYLAERKPDRTLRNNSFTLGEHLTYRIHVGPINAAKGEMIIDDKAHEVDGRPCYKMDVFGRTNGVFDWIIKVRDNWGTYVDTTSILPLQSYRYIAEGKYRKNEIVHFDHANDTVLVHKLNKQTKELDTIVGHSVCKYSQGLISGYYYLRVLNFNHLEIGDTISIGGFFDGDNYTLGLRYLGEENLNTKLGRIDSYVLAPIMPESSVFDGENSVKIWLSSDHRRIPLKAKAKLFIGALEVDIQSASGLREN